MIRLLLFLLFHFQFSEIFSTENKHYIRVFYYYYNNKVLNYHIFTINSQSNYSRINSILAFIIRLRKFIEIIVKFK